MHHLHTHFPFFGEDEAFDRRLELEGLGREGGKEGGREGGREG